MSRVLTIISLSVLFGLAAPIVQAAAPSEDAPRAESPAPDLASAKKKGGGRSGGGGGGGKKGGSSSGGNSGGKKGGNSGNSGNSGNGGERPAPSRPAANAQRPAPQGQAPTQARPAPQQPPQPAAQQPLQQPAGQQAAQQRPAAQQPATAPSQQRPGVQSRPGQSGPAARPDNPGQQGQVRPQAGRPNPATTAHSQRPTGHASAVGPQGAHMAGTTHRSVHRPPAGNIAGAHRQAQQSQRAQGNDGRHGNQGNQAAHHQRVTKAHAKARHHQSTRHRHHAHASWARRAYYARHHRHNHGWHWRHRPWWPRHAYYGHPWYHPGWAYGVFIYGPRPVRHSVYVSGTSAPAEPEPPRRAVDRNHKWAVGIRSGSYMSGYEHGPGFGDFGLGLAARYRAAEALGFELAWQHHDQTWTQETERWSEPFAASVQLFGLPWTRFNPYVSAGITWTNRSYRDSYRDGYGVHEVSEDHTLFGPHGGLGLELGVGDNASVNLEARMVGYLNVEDDDRALPTALQSNAGVNFYF